MSKPRIVILAGPNGAGKTTAAKYLLTEAFGIVEFVNADIIAAGLSAYAPESVAFEAGRVMLSRINALLMANKSFAFETTLSSKSFARLIPRAREAGYYVTLVYVALPSASLAKRRVAKRVKSGGHNIPTDVIERRFKRSLTNLVDRYRVLVDEWFVYDNAELKAPTIIAFGTNKSSTVVEDKKWQRLLKLAAQTEK